MIANRKALARKALTAALAARTRAKCTLWDAVSIYDVAEQLGVQVRFLDAPSMEGLYCKHPGPLILLPAARPSVRQAYSCAHELGHHTAGHGTHVDELRDDQTEDSGIFDDPDEFFAECFAGFLLMPKLAVERAIARRHWSTQTLTAPQAYILAGFLGVGYTTLITHMRWSLGLLSETSASALSKVQPKDIRRTWLDKNGTHNLIIVDTQWCGRPVDAQVGDFILVPAGTHLEAANLQFIGETTLGKLLQVQFAGVGRISEPHSAWASFVRTSRTGYIGLAKYRHLEDDSNA